ncbi:MAG: NUDIX hydrolase [Aerococcaceae bacterium]|nr:NUDIX hydrolase [Aerococcaceae bacterium]
MTEKWNAYLKDGTCTAMALYRDQPIPPGYYHLVVEAIVQHDDQSLLFMKRDNAKASYPHYWECSAGGSALFGENAEQAIRRETLEETGLVLYDLRHYQTFVNEPHQCYFECFVAKTSDDKSQVRLQKGETEAFEWVSLADLANFLDNALVIPRHKEVLQTLFLTHKKSFVPS